MIRMTPLPASFMLIAMLGLIITTVYTAYGKLALSWGIAFDIIFAVMFIASILSITPSQPKAEEAPPAKPRRRVRKAKKRKKR